MRACLVVTTTLAIATVSALAASASPAGSTPLMALRSDVTRAVASVRPAAAAPVGAAATEFLPPIVITVGRDVTLQDKLTMTGTVTISCGPFLSTSFSGAFIQITEPAGHTVAHASGSIPALICDGAPHSFAFTATANDVPFHPSTGQAQVFASACGTASDFTFQCESGQTTASVSIKM